MYRPKLWLPNTLKAIYCSTCGKRHLLSTLVKPFFSAYNIGPCACCGGGGEGCNTNHALCDPEAAAPSEAHINIDGLLDGDPIRTVGNGFGGGSGTYGLCPNIDIFQVATFPTITGPTCETEDPPFTGTVTDCNSSELGDSEDWVEYYTSESKCFASNLNGGYSTSDITESFGVWTATFHVGTSMSTSDPGIKVREHNQTGKGCALFPDGESVSIKCEDYITQIIATYRCQACPQGTASKIRLLSVTTSGGFHIRTWSGDVDGEDPDTPTSPTAYSGGCFACVANYCPGQKDDNCLTATGLMPNVYQKWPYDPDCFASLAAYCAGASPGAPVFWPEGCYDGPGEANYDCPECTALNRDLTNRHGVCNSCASCGKEGLVEISGGMS